MLVSKIKEISNGKILDFLFLAWLPTLPFGSNIGGISLGFMTIYPNLIFSLLLIPISLLGFKQWSLISKLILTFLFLWLIFGLGYGYMQSFVPEAIFDIRSLFMQFFFALILIGVHSNIGKDTFGKHLVTGLRAFLAVLIFSGIIEFLTGNHFQGFTTDKFIDLPVGPVFYAPLFIYDNANDYLCYAICVLLLLLLFDFKLRENKFLIIILILILFVFSVFADSKAGILLTSFLLFVQGIWAFYRNYRSITLKNIIPYGITGILLVLLIIKNPIFYGPKYKNSSAYRLNEVKVVIEEDDKFKVETAKKYYSKKDQERIISYLDSANTKSPETSTNLRKDLFLNGMEFIKEKPLTGIGPGMYQHKHRSNQVKHNVGGQSSAHNFPIEIISQYGIIAWTYFLLILVLFISFVRKGKIIFQSDNPWIYAFFISLPLLWILPSAFLYQPINWLILPLLGVLFNNLYSNKTA